MTLGVGAGQMNRVDSARIASMKAANAGLSLQGAAVVSDAFFPLRDGLGTVIGQGAACVIQPGGSERSGSHRSRRTRCGDGFTGVGHFRH
jgi:phosphoribosylaminoimidazolecarboxamide formyltransferase/IMP cyclohydrolase